MSLQEILGRIRSSPRPPNEEAAKIQVIAPILRSLGWDYTDGRQVAFEHNVGGGKDGGRVDIALKGSHGLVALIEAKAPGVDLNSSVSQVLRYAFHEGADICVLTTGLVWWFYLPWVKGTPEDRRFAVLDIHRDPLEQLADDLEDFLGKRSLETGNAVAHAERALTGQRKRALPGVKSPAIPMPVHRGARQGGPEFISNRGGGGGQQLGARPPQSPHYHIDPNRKPRRFAAMMTLAILFPIHGYLLQRRKWAIIWTIGAATFLIMGGIGGAVAPEEGTANSTNAAYTIITLIAMAGFFAAATGWIVGMVKCRKWTIAYNATASPRPTATQSTQIMVPPQQTQPVQQYPPQSTIQQYPQPHYPHQQQQPPPVIIQQTLAPPQKRSGCLVALAIVGAIFLLIILISIIAAIAVTPIPTTTTTP